MIMSIRVIVLEASKSTYPSLCITAVSHGNGKASQSRAEFGGKSMSAKQFWLSSLKLGKKWQKRSDGS